MKILGLGHYSRVGKDSLANYLLSYMNARHPSLRVAKMSFAYKLKQITYELYAWAGMREPEFYETVEGAPYRDIPLPGINKTPVQIWVDMGTPAVRNCVYDRTWIDYVLKHDHGVDALVIPDVRFANEVMAIQDAGGKIVKVVRPGYGPRRTVADRALVGFTGWDYVVGASGKMSELAEWAAGFGEALVTGAWPFQTLNEKAQALYVEVVEPWEAAA